MAEIAASLGRAPNEADLVDVQVIAPGTMYGPRLNQLDVRVTKILTFGGSRVQVMFDLYNALNCNTTLILNDEYGAAGFGATSDWGRPGAILPGMLAKFGFQVDF